jgi:hypothetical protein
MVLVNATGIWDVSDYGSTPNFNASVRAEVSITKKDREVLRRLAEKVAKLAARPTEQEKRDLWHKHNALGPTRPLIFCDPENGWNEIITENQLECTGRLAQHWEVVLRKEIFWGGSMCDDKVIEPYFNIGYTYTESDWGVEPIFYGGKGGGSYVWDPPIKEYKETEKLRYPTIEVDYETTQLTFELAKDTFGDLLTVKIKGVWWWSLGMTYTLALLRGLQQIMFDMVDNPEFVHHLMNILSTGTLAKLDFLETNNLLSLNVDSYVGSGGFGYTKELPSKDFDGHVRTQDMWGFCESQETLGISPDMFAEFVFAYQLPILKRFGLNCYGCCEPLEARWRVIRETPNLRRVSVSSFADLEKMAEFLEDKYIYSMKPSPTDLALPDIDEEYIRKKLRRAFEITKNCRVEVIMKDNHTIGNNPQNVIKWVKIAKEEAERSAG